MGVRRLIAAGLAVPTCAMAVATALAAPASGGRHLPYFSLLNERVAVKSLPPETLLFAGLGRPSGTGRPRPLHGSVWFGEVERPNATITAVGQGHSVCEFERPKDLTRGSGGNCTTVAGARELGLLDITSCGKGPPRHFRIHGLVPNGVSGLEIERSDGTIGRTVPVIRNTVAFTVGREDLKLHGVGDAAATQLERTLPLAHAGLPGDNRPGCASYIFFEAKSDG